MKAIKALVADILWKNISVCYYSNRLLKLRNFQREIRCKNKVADAYV